MARLYMIKNCRPVLLLLSAMLMFGSTGCGSSSDDFNAFAASNNQAEAQFVSVLRQVAPQHRQQFNTALADLGKMLTKTATSKELNEPGGSGPYNQALALTYYDRGHAFYTVADLLGEKDWLSLGDEAVKFYRDRYILHPELPESQRGVVPGYWIFSDGLRIHYERTKDNRSKDALILLTQRGRYASKDPIAHARAESVERGREVAYGLIAHLNAERIGKPIEPWRNELIKLSLGHIDQWLGTKPWDGIDSEKPYLVSFMTAITARAVVEAIEAKAIPAAEQGVAIEKLIALADRLWEKNWLAKERAFRYSDREALASERFPKGALFTTAAPDLNLLIFPLYAWLAERTTDPRHQERAVTILEGGLNGAYWVGGKQFNQQLFWVARGLKALAAQ